MESLITFIQLILSCTLSPLPITLCVYQIIMAGGWRWWFIPMFSFVILVVLLVYQLWKEYKQEKDR